jgi:hypothetical protein
LDAVKLSRVNQLFFGDNSHYLKIVLDGVFGKKTSAKNDCASPRKN